MLLQLHVHYYTADDQGHVICARERDSAIQRAPASLDPPSSRVKLSLHKGHIARSVYTLKSSPVTHHVNLHPLHRLDDLSASIPYFSTQPIVFDIILLASRTSNSHPTLIPRIHRSSACGPSTFHPPVCFFPCSSTPRKLYAHKGTVPVSPVPLCKARRDARDVAPFGQVRLVLFAHGKKNVHGGFGVFHL